MDQTSVSNMDNNSPTARLMKLKRQSSSPTAQRLDMNFLLQIDSDLTLRKMRKSSNNNDQKINFFDKLEEMSSHSNFCPPGSILPHVPTSKQSSSLHHLEPLVGDFNATHRSVGYSSPPTAPYRSLSKTRYETNLQKKIRREEQPTRKQKSPQHATTVSPTSRTEISSHTSGGSGSKGGGAAASLALIEEEAMLEGIMKMHQQAVQRANQLNKKHGIGRTAHVLYDNERRRDHAERQKKLSDALIYDAETSVRNVVAREAKRLERIARVQGRSRR